MTKFADLTTKLTTVTFALVLSSALIFGTVAPQPANEASTAGTVAARVA